MSERHHQYAEAARALAPRPFSTLEATEFEAEVRRRHRERRTRRRVVASALVLVAVIVGVGLRLRPTSERPTDAVAIGEDARVVMPIDSPVHTRSSEAGLLWLELESGTARFVVAPQHGRVVRISAGAVDVEVIGTAFSVARAAHEVEVAVTEGRVRVRVGPRDTLLSAGERGRFPLELASPPPPELRPAEEAAVADVPAPTPRAAPPKPPRRVVTWRALGEKGDFGHAWAAMQREGAPDDEPGDLLRAADVARLSGHPAAALVPLRRVLSHFKSDPRASLAAFTLGRVLMDDLGNPREAAEAFLVAHALAPKSPLAPDALARAVEAQARAGDGEAARSTAEQFLTEFPQSGRVDAVRRWGGVDSGDRSKPAHP
jgi:transmembrane sensor